MFFTVLQNADPDFWDLTKILLALAEHVKMIVATKMTTPAVPLAYECGLASVLNSPI